MATVRVTDPPKTKEEYDRWILTEEGKKWKRSEQKQAAKELYRICCPFLSSMPIGYVILAILAILINIMFMFI